MKKTKPKKPTSFLPTIFAKKPTNGKKRKSRSALQRTFNTKGEVK